MRIKTLIAIVFGLVILLIARCANPSSGTDTGNAKISGVLHNADGTRAAHAKVACIPRNHNPHDGPPANADSTETDDTGGYRFKTMPADTYTILAVSGDTAMAYIDSIVVTPDTQTRLILTDTLHSPGTLRGRIELVEGGDGRRIIIAVRGTTTMFIPEDSLGNFVTPLMAKGRYRVTIIPLLPDYAVMDTGFSISTGRNDTLPQPIQLRYTGIPTPKNLRVSFDTINQTVVLSWDMPDTSLIFGFNVYRSTKGQNFSLITQTPLPKTQTTYLDTGLTVGNVYEYRVLSRTAAGVESRMMDFDADTVLIVSVSMVTTTFSWNSIDTASIYDTMPVIVNFTNPTRMISGLEWYIDTAQLPMRTKNCSSRSGNDTLEYYCPAQAGLRKLIVKAVDAANTEWRDTFELRVIWDIPVPIAGPDTTVSINDTVWLHASATDRFGYIVSRAWDIGNTGAFIQTLRNDTIIIAPDSESLNYLCVFRVTDDDGNIAEDTVKVSVLQDMPVANVGNDTTVSINDTFYVHADGSDVYGRIVKYRFDSNNDKVFEDSAVSPSVKSFRAVADSCDCLVILQVEDDDGNKSNDAMVVHVLLDPPVAQITTASVIRIDSTFLISSSASSHSNFGFITKREWSIGNFTTFVETDTSDTIIKAPTFETDSFAIVLRVTDDDGVIGLDTHYVKITKKWVLLGNAGFMGPVHSASPSLFVYNDKPYVATTSGLMEYNGSNWITVGSISFSGHPSLFVYNDTPYVASQNGVMKYDGSNWIAVGSPTPFDGDPSLYVYNDIPYVAVGNGVKKYDGSNWITLGSQTFTATNRLTSQKNNALFVYNDTPFVAYTDTTNGDRATVKKYDGSNWITVGNPGFSVGTAYYISIFVYNGSPFVAYGGNSNKATVMKYDGSNWINAGNAEFSASSAPYISFFVYNGTPYVAFMDYAIGQRSTVMKYVNSKWQTVGTAGFSAGRAFGISLYVCNGTPYVAYWDEANGDKVSVMVYK